MSQPLILLRLVGVVIGGLILSQAFWWFRAHSIRSREFLLRALVGTALLLVAIWPDTVNAVAGMLALRNQQFGRLIALLVLSNLALWLLVVGLRTKDSLRSHQLDLLVRRYATDRALDVLPARPPIVAVLPALNEAESLDVLLPRFPPLVCGVPLGVLVVDDGSSDGTPEVVARHGHAVVSNPFTRGGGAALRLGSDVASRHGARVVVTMDADGQHLPEEIEGLVQPILADEADIVIGSRVLGKREKDSAARWVGIHVFNALINLLAGTRISDCSNGFRAFRLAALERVHLRQDQFHTAELIIDAARKQLRIREVPVTVLRRHAGESKKGKSLRYGLNFSKTIVKTWLRE